MQVLVFVYLKILRFKDRESTKSVMILISEATLASSEGESDSLRRRVDAGAVGWGWARE